MRPVMIVDAHVHIFPPELIGQRESLLKSDPAFNLLYTDPQAQMAAAGDLVEAMNSDGVGAALVCGFPWRDAGRAQLHNDYILQAAKDHPGRLIPLGCVDPLAQEAREEAERVLAAGAAGLGELARYHNDLGTEMIPLARLCAEADRPLMLHTNEPVGHSYPGKSPMTFRGLYDLVKACPDTRFQLAHLGGGVFFFELLKLEAAGVLARCVFDMAAAVFLYKPEVYPVFIRLAGADRLLYGSDFPLLRLPRYLKDLDQAGLDAGVKEKILGLNAKAFWNI
jgi:predicted TIM-barrel fold metal-dependent hydrolase